MGNPHLPHIIEHALPRAAFELPGEVFFALSHMPGDFSERQIPGEMFDNVFTRRIAERLCPRRAARRAGLGRLPDFAGQQDNHFRAN